MVAIIRQAFVQKGRGREVEVTSTGGQLLLTDRSDHYFLIILAWFYSGYFSPVVQWSCIKQKIGLSTNSYGVFHQMFSENITNNSLKGHCQLERVNYYFLTSQPISGVSWFSYLLLKNM